MRSSGVVFRESSRVFKPNWFDLGAAVSAVALGTLALLAALRVFIPSVGYGALGGLGGIILAEVMYRVIVTLRKHHETSIVVESEPFSPKVGKIAPSLEPPSLIKEKLSKACPYLKAQILLELAKAHPSKEAWEAAKSAVDQNLEGSEKVRARLELAKVEGSDESWAVVRKAVKLLKHDYEIIPILLEVIQDLISVNRFKEALEMAHQFHGSILEYWAWSKIAKALVDAGLFEEALELIDKIYDQSYKCEVLIKIAKKEGSERAWEEAKKATYSLKERTVLVEKALLKLAKAQVGTGLFEEAKRSIDRLRGEDSKAQVLLALAKAQPTQENWENVRQAADRIILTATKMEILSGIAKGEGSEAGWIAFREEVLKISMGCVSTKAAAYLELAKAYPSKESWQEAKQAAYQISDKWDRAQALLNIAKASPSLQNWEAAKEAWDQTFEGSDQARAYQELAKLLVALSH